MSKILVLAAVCSSALFFPFAGSAAGAPSVTCPQDTQAFSGAAYDLIVPADGFCEVTNATVAHDIVVQDDAGLQATQVAVGHDIAAGADTDVVLSQVTVGHDVSGGSDTDYHLELTSITHDLVAFQPLTVQTGRNRASSPGGPVKVGHNVTISGSPDGEDFVFDGFCNLTVGHDMQVTDRWVTLGMNVGDSCAGRGVPAVSVAHDLVLTGDSALDGFFGPSAIEVGGDQVGNDLVFTGNSAVTGGYLEVADNTVLGDAVCASNDPAPSHDAGDGPNTVGHSDSCD